MYIHVRVCMRVRVCIHTCVYKYTQNIYNYSYAPAYIYAITRTHIPTHTHTHTTHTHTHTHTYTHTHTHIHAHIQGWGAKLGDEFTLEAYEWAVALVAARALFAPKFEGQYILAPFVDGAYVGPPTPGES